jgi:hypothetical protein
MTRHIDFGQLQDFREGLLSLEEQEGVRAHLETCPVCRGDLEALDELMDGVGALPREAEPDRDLWPQIEWRIKAHGAPDGVGLGPESAPRRSRRPVTLQAWQLLAAGVVLALVSGGAVWAALSGRFQGPAPVSPGVVQATLTRPVGWESALDEYRQAVVDLEDVLEVGKDVLDPETVRILEENLRTIDAAIGEAQAALAQDPGSRVLGRFLAENLRRKIDLLRRAAAAVYANT